MGVKTMTYYRVKPEFDNKPRYKRKYKHLKLYNDGIWVGNELYTPGEMDRMKKNNVIISEKYFTRVEIKKTETYWFFGARFSNDTGVDIPF